MDDAGVTEFGELFRQFLDQIVQREQPDETRDLTKRIQAHMGGDPSTLPIVKGTYPEFDHPNVHLALDRWFTTQGRTHELVGITGIDHRGLFSFSELIENAHRYDRFVLGSVDYRYLPISPDEEMACVNTGFYLGTDGADRFVVLLRGPNDFERGSGVKLEVLAPTEDAGRRMLAGLDALIREHNIFRGKILSLQQSGLDEGIGPFRFHPRPGLRSGDIVLPNGLLDRVERQVVGVARRREQLSALGQHLRRGLLLYGPPGTGKTHTIRYLLSQLPEFTAVVLSGESIGQIAAACSMARKLQPALVILEDCDLVAEARDYIEGSQPLLFQVLNEMDGLGDNVDVAFLLTTNRADLLEPALAQRPGRVDMAVEIPLPDEDGRRRLIALYGSGLDLPAGLVEEVVTRTAGTTASFAKELVRRAVLLAAEREITYLPQPVDVREALDELLSDQDTLTRRLLGVRGTGQDEEPADDDDPPAPA